MKPEYSLTAILEYPAPKRELYFTGRDYAMACMRTHEKRLKRDGKIKVERPATGHKGKVK